MNMEWQHKLKQLEDLNEWDTAIEYMQKTIEVNPDNVDAYIYINFLLMNLLVEEDYDERQYNYYQALIKTYFDKSYTKFSHNPKYLFYTGITACMSEWYFGIDLDTAEAMIQKSMHLEPDNALYQWAYYGSLNMKQEENQKKALVYSKTVLDENSSIQKQLQAMGAVGKYLLDIMKNRSKKIVDGYAFF